MTSLRMEISRDTKNTSWVSTQPVAFFEDPPHPSKLQFVALFCFFCCSAIFLKLCLCLRQKSINQFFFFSQKSIVGSRSKHFNFHAAECKKLNGSAEHIITDDSLSCCVTVTPPRVCVCWMVRSVCAFFFFFFVAFLCLTFSAVTHLGVGRVRLNKRIRKGRLIAEQKVADPRLLRQDSIATVLCVNSEKRNGFTAPNHILRPGWGTIAALQQANKVKNYF